MTVGRTIKLFLAEGTSSGVMTAEIMNWTGKLIVFSRSKLPSLAGRDDAQKTGIYLLVGMDPEASTRDRVYVGEADNVFFRLKEHDRLDQKAFWERTVVIISKDENLTKSHGRYLEARLIDMIKSAGRATQENHSFPSPPPLPESDRADMDFFLDQIRLMLPVLGFSFLKPKLDRTGDSSTAEEHTLFGFTYAGASAKAVETGDEFVVIKGSTARVEGTGSWDTYRALRDRLVHDGKLVISEKEGFYVFSEDVAFSSPSAAATVVAAHNQNGRERWVTEAGTTYAQWKERQLSEGQEND